MKTAITVSECYGPVTAGEGPVIGLPTIFVRTGGCDFRCRWCDSMHAVDHVNFGGYWKQLNTGDVLNRIIELSGGVPVLVSLSGGNPALQPFGDLIKLGHDMGYTFALETQGTVSQDWFSGLDHLILSPKGPSAKVPAFNLTKFEKCVAAAGPRTSIAIKIVIFDYEDYGFATSFRDWLKDRPRGSNPIAMYLQPGTDLGLAHEDINTLRASILERVVWLTEMVKADYWHDVRILPQFHALIHGNKQGI